MIREDVRKTGLRQQRRNNGQQGELLSSFITFLYIPRVETGAT
jgi:hypothetical protein